MYADNVTGSMQRAIDETGRRRARQVAHNKLHDITPKGVVKQIRDLIDGIYDAQEAQQELKVAQREAAYLAMSEKELTRAIKRVEKEMFESAKNLEFEHAAELRDELNKLKQQLFTAVPT
jgi:excinuclease ABC subunit B